MKEFKDWLVAFFLAFMAVGGLLGAAISIALGPGYALIAMFILLLCVIAIVVFIKNEIY